MDSCVGRVAKIFLQLLRGKLAVPISGEDKLPQGPLLFRYIALGQSVQEGFCGVGGRQSLWYTFSMK